MNILFLTSAAPARAPIPTAEKRPPLGMGYLMAVLKEKGHTIFFSDEYLAPTAILDGDYLQKNRIDYVGIYSNTICYASTLEMFQKLQQKREHGQWKGKIMVGGPHTAFGSGEIPQYVDHIVIGEGEITVPKIIDGQIKERIVRGEKVPELDALPFPAWEEFIHLPYMWWDRRIEGQPLYTFNTSRGCPYACTFCSVKGVWGKNYRYMSADRVLQDVEYMKKVYGLKAAYFREDHFTLNPKRTIEFCEKLLSKQTGINWMCESRVDSIDDPAIVELMAKSGCKALYIGVESGSPRMLSLFKKEETVDQFVRVFAYAKKYGIKTHASFVVGAPGETAEDDRLTDKLIETIKPDSVRKNIYIGLPGAELYDYAKTNQLYEHQDEQGILYLKGYHEKIDKYYGGDPDYKTYDPSGQEGEPALIYFKKHRQIDGILKIDPDLNITHLENRFFMEKEPALLEAYLEEIILKVWKPEEDGKKRNIALYGAGTHTALILAIIRRLDLTPPVVIFDMKPKSALVKELSIDRIENITEYNIDAVLISNDRAHYEIYCQLIKQPGPKKIEIIDPYLYLPHAPFRKK